MQPRLQAAGLALHWDVQELPALPGFTPTAVLQVQRIVLEALTNVVKHARAGNVWVNCRAEGAGDPGDVVEHMGVKIDRIRHRITH